MRRILVVLGLGVALATLATLVGCGGGGGGGDDGTQPPPPAGGIGAGGGTASGANGAAVVVPAGALSSTVNVAIDRSAAGSPALPANTERVGEVHALTPHGTTFMSPVTVTVPFDTAAVSAGRTVGLMKTNAAGNAWEMVPGTTVAGGLVSAPVSSFSWLVAVLVPAAPSILAQPASISVPLGQGASFSVVANGSPPLQYQWLRDGTPIAGAQAASYTLAATSAADDGAQFSVRVSNATGSVVSAAATLTVLAAGSSGRLTIAGDAAPYSNGLLDAPAIAVVESGPTCAGPRCISVFGLVAGVDDADPAPGITVAQSLSVRITSDTAPPGAAPGTGATTIEVGYGVARTEGPMNITGAGYRLDCGPRFTPCTDPDAAGISVDRQQRTVRFANTTLRHTTTPGLTTTFNGTLRY
jgi:hypothetical protein